MSSIKSIVRTLVVAVLCVAGTLLMPTPAAHAADNDVYDIPFYGKELLQFKCAIAGGRYYEYGTGYGCFLPNGGTVWCDNGACVYYAYTVPPGNVHGPIVGGEIDDAVDPFPGPSGGGRQQVLGLYADPTMTIAQVRRAARGTAGEVDVVDQVLLVQTATSALSSEQLSSLMAGRSAAGADLVGAVEDPSPDATVGGVSARMRVPGKRVLVLRGEILIDGRQVPVLTLVILF